MALGPVGAWEGGGRGNELGGSGSEFHGNIPNKKPQTKFIWVPSGLCHSVMVEQGRVDTGCAAVWACAGTSEPLW